MGSIDHAPSRERLCLMETEDGDAIWIRKIVRGGDRLCFVLLITDVMPGEPLAGTRARSAISNMQARFQGAPIRFSTCFQAATGRSRIQY
jgi:hypothetical protein